MEQRNKILLKRKEDQYENEVNKMSSAPIEYVPVHYGDRFIPRRLSLQNWERNLKFVSEKPQEDLLSLTFNKDYWRSSNYTHMINYTMQMEEDRILDFIDPVVKSTRFIPKSNFRDTKDWPCRPRLKPSANVYSTFFLEEIDDSSDHNRVDWSARGQIAFCYRGNIIIWLVQENETIKFEVHHPRSLAYSLDGQFLAIGCKTPMFPALELWDVSDSDNICVANGKVFTPNQVAVQCIQWTVPNKQLVCGTHYGAIYVLSVPDLQIIKYIREHYLPITILRISPNTHYLASGDSAGNIVIYDWNMLSVYLYVRSRRKLSVIFDWHPWARADLAIAEDNPASIVILNIPTKKIVACYQRNNSKVAINYITFSKLTGELLVSISNQDNHYKEYRVLVLSSFDRIVDILSVPDDDVRFLTWNPDGTAVATTNDYEELYLWHFTSMKQTEKPKNHSSLKSYFGNQLRKWCLFR